MQRRPRRQPRSGSLPWLVRLPAVGSPPTTRDMAPLPPFSITRSLFGKEVAANPPRTAPCECPGRPPPRAASPAARGSDRPSARPGPAPPPRPPPRSRCPRPAPGGNGAGGPCRRRPRMPGAGEGHCGGCSLRCPHGGRCCLRSVLTLPLSPLLSPRLAHTLSPLPAPSPAPTVARRVPFPGCPSPFLFGSSVSWSPLLFPAVYVAHLRLLVFFQISFSLHGIT